MKIRLLSIGLLSIASFLLLISSCKMPNDGIPLYMRMDSVQVNTSSGQGSNSHNITDVWVEANADNVGAFGVPCNIPVLQENDVRFVVSAGVKESGQSGVRVIYPFYTTDTFSIVGVRGEHYSHKPVFTYVTGTQFAFTENFDLTNGFEPLNTSITLASSPDVDPVYGGSRCLKLTVSAADSNEMATTIDTFDLPEGLEIWLEVDYKSEVPFYIGFNGYFKGSNTAYPVPVLFVNAQPKWNKVYVKLSSLMGNLRADTYKIYFEALRPYGTSGGNVYIDNVKLVHF
jgi:hypothetical protein